MSFERKPMEALVERMVNWTQGVSNRLTDFRVGSKIRTIYEAVALIVEEQYDRMFRAIRQLIEDNIYAIIGFDKIPATYATGIATFSRSTPAEQNYVIYAGTGLTSQATEFNPPLKFYTVEDAILAVGTTSVNTPVVAEKPGVSGNIAAGTLVNFIQKPIGVESVTNAMNFGTGKEEETKEAQKARFQSFMEAQARGVLQSIEYGAKLAAVINPVTGQTVEKVFQSVALEDLANRRGEVDLYIWNGQGEASEGLRAVVNSLMTGFFDTNGNPVYGFKPAGILVNIYSAPIKYVTIKVEITPEVSTTVAALKSTIESEIDRYFLDLKLGQTAIQSALQSNVKLIEGVKDVKLFFSLDDGTTWSMDNITAQVREIVVVKKPLVY